MPGMMDTILNLGLNNTVVEGLARLTDNERFAYDSYRRFIQMFSDVVMGIPKPKFEQILDEIKEAKGAKHDTELTADDLKEVVNRYKELYKKEKASISAGSEGTTDGSRKGRVPFMGESEGDSLQEAE